VPLKYWVDHQRRLVVAKGVGLLSDDEVFTYQREAWSTPELAGYAEIVDMSDVERVDLPSIDRIRELAELAASMDPNLGSSKLAVVATRDFAYGLARMYETYRELQAGSAKPVGVFRTMREAQEFLGIDGEISPPGDL
jgi:hypothetical protein